LYSKENPCSRKNILGHTTQLPACRPFLKWAGGKYRLISQIRALLPAGNLFIEPFVGAGAVFLNLDFPAYQLNDINADLIYLFKTVQKDAAALTECAKRLFTTRNNTASAYYRLRKKFNQLPPSLERAALFLFLNRHSYNGLCRFNAAGQFNAPFGSYSKPYFPLLELQMFAEKTKKAKFYNQSFEKIIEKAPANAVIYCDPPYVPLSVSASFTSYAGNTFTEADQVRLAEISEAAANRGCTILISNHDTPFTQTLYRIAQRISLPVQRSISCQQRLPVSEILALFT